MTKWGMNYTAGFHKLSDAGMNPGSHFHVRVHSSRFLHIQKKVILDQLTAGLDVQDLSDDRYVGSDFVIFPVIPLDHCFCASDKPKAILCLRCLDPRFWVRKAVPEMLARV